MASRSATRAPPIRRGRFASTLNGEKKRQPRDPGSNTEPGAPCVSVLVCQDEKLARLIDINGLGWRKSVGPPVQEREEKGKTAPSETKGAAPGRDLFGRRSGMLKGVLLGTQVPLGG